MQRQIYRHARAALAALLALAYLAGFALRELPAQDEAQRGRFRAPRERRASGDYLADHDRKTLERFHVAADAAGLQAYFERIQPGAVGEDRIVELVAQLGAGQFLARDAATQELLAVGTPALAHLETATRSRDAEVRFRAAWILEELATGQRELLLAALRSVPRYEASAAVPLVLKIFEQCNDEVTRGAAVEAIVRVSLEEHAPLLRQALQGDMLEERIAAVRALARLFGKESLADLLPLLDDPSHDVQLAAVREIIPHQPRSCVAPLIGLLESDRANVRQRAYVLLRELTGQSFDYVPHGAPKERAVAVARWHEWYIEEGAAAELASQLTGKADIVGRMILCKFHPFEVVEKNLVEWEGPTTFTTDKIGAPCGCVGFADGRRVIADWNSHSVVLFDADGREAWRHGVGGTPNGLHALENGNFLVAVMNTNRILELTPEGKTVWEAKVESGPTDCQRLANGNTLVALHTTNRVAEINAEGKVVWMAGQLEGPESARRLESGNTLVACGHANRVVEIDADGRVVWSITDIPQPYDALQLENGNVVVGFGQGLREYDREGKIVREAKLGTIRRIGLY